jgi:hypothetical protein
MVKKKVLVTERVREIDGGFSFIPHRFVTDGFLSSLDQIPLLLYLFLSVVADRHGLSFYRYDSICSLLQLTADQYVDARNELIEKNLIAFDGMLFQVLSLPKQVTRRPQVRVCRSSEQTSPLESIGQVLQASFKGQADE